MRSQRWTITVAAAWGCLMSKAGAQTGGLKDLGSVLAGEKNLTTFYSLIQVCTTNSFWWRVRNTLIIFWPSKRVFSMLPKLKDEFQLQMELVARIGLPLAIIKKSKRLQSNLLIYTTEIPSDLNPTSFAEWCHGELPFSGRFPY
jgi:hypothetical protein